MELLRRSRGIGITGFEAEESWPKPDGFFSCSFCEFVMLYPEVNDVLKAEVGWICCTGSFLLVLASSISFGGVTSRVELKANLPVEIEPRVPLLNVPGDELEALILLFPLFLLLLETESDWSELLSLSPSSGVWI